MLKFIFKKQYHTSYESVENIEIADYAANNKIAEIEEEEFVSVNFVRTNMGTVFFMHL